MLSHAHQLVHIVERLDDSVESLIVFWTVLQETGNKSDLLLIAVSGFGVPKAAYAASAAGAAQLHALVQAAEVDALAEGKQVTSSAVQFRSDFSQLHHCTFTMQCKATCLWCSWGYSYDNLEKLACLSSRTCTHTCLL